MSQNQQKRNNNYRKGSQVSSNSVNRGISQLSKP